MRVTDGSGKCSSDLSTSSRNSSLERLTSESKSRAMAFHRSPSACENTPFVFCPLASYLSLAKARIDLSSVFGSSVTYSLSFRLSVWKRVSVTTLWLHCNCLPRALIQKAQAHGQGRSLWRVPKRNRAQTTHPRKTKVFELLPQLRSRCSRRREPAAASSVSSSSRNSERLNEWRRSPSHRLQKLQLNQTPRRIILVRLLHCGLVAARIHQSQAAELCVRHLSQVTPWRASH